LENRGSKNDEVSRGVWQAVEASIEKIGIREAEGRRSKRRSRKKERKEG